MPRRGENIYKRKDGRWEGRVLKSDGSYRYFYAYAYREVKDKMKNFHLTVMNQEPEQEPSAQNAESLFKSWLEGDLCHQIKPSTFESYHYCMHHYILPFFTCPEKLEITAQTVERFTQYLEENSSISVSYRRKIMTILKTALRELLADTAQYSSVMKSIRMPKAHSHEVQVFTIQEQRLIEYTALQSEDKRAIGIILCLYTGIRLGELCGLKWADLDCEAGTISVARTVTRTKNFAEDGKKTMLYIGTPKSRKSVRKIPLPAFLLSLAAIYKAPVNGENKFIFSASDTPPDPRTLQKLFDKILKSASVKHRKFHAMRHTFATRALELGVDIKTLSEILGHASASITLNVYAHSLMEHKKIAIDKLNDMHLNCILSASFAVNSAV